MIGMLRGTIWEIQADKLIVDVAGTGYELFVPSRLSATVILGEERLFYTYLLMRQDEISLFGFAGAREKDLFTKLIGVSGVGPKAALALLSVYEAPSLAAAIVQEHYALLTQAPGVGLKTAQRLSLELKGKLSDIAWQEASFKSENGKEDKEFGEGKGFGKDKEFGKDKGFGLDVLDSLLALGFTLAESKRALQAVQKIDGLTGTEARLKEALRLLARG